jgi:hypothetical protein
MYLEAFHRVLKVIYLHQKQNRRIDSLLITLIKVARDKAFERLQKVEMGKSSHRTSAAMMTSITKMKMMIMLMLMTMTTTMTMMIRKMMRTMIRKMMRTMIRTMMRTMMRTTFHILRDFSKLRELEVEHLPHCENLLAIKTAMKHIQAAISVVSTIGGEGDDIHLPYILCLWTRLKHDRERFLNEN